MKERNAMNRWMPALIMGAVCLPGCSHLESIHKSMGGSAVTEKQVSEAGEPVQCASQFTSGPAHSGEPSPRQDGGKAYLDAVYWCTKAAEKGDSRAQYLLAILYEKGAGVTKNQQTAIRWFRQSAEHGNADAQFRMGLIHGKGEGVPLDKSEATRWYAMAASQGNADAQFFMGYRYEHGKGIAQSYPEAWRWYLKAAEQGNASAMHYLGGMVLEGRGIPQNHMEAYKWYNLAAATGDKNYVTSRDKVAKKLSPRQLEEGQKLAGEWARSHSAPWRSSYP